MFYPSFKDFKKKAQEGNLIPVYKEIYADMETPVSAFIKIDESNFSFLLESVEGGEKWGRYSFLGSGPSLIFKSKGREVTIISDNKSRSFTTSTNPLDVLKEIMDKFRPVKIPGLPRFFGGAVGFLSYDFVRFFEEIPDYTKDELELPDAVRYAMEVLAERFKVVLAQGMVLDLSYRADVAFITQRLANLQVNL